LLTSYVDCQPAPYRFVRRGRNDTGEAREESWLWHVE
jgi:hypothetical protein